MKRSEVISNLSEDVRVSKIVDMGAADGYSVYVTEGYFVDGNYISFEADNYGDIIDTLTNDVKKEEV